MSRIESLKTAIKQKNLAQFKKLLSSLDEEDFLASDEGNTLVHLAVIYDQPDILEVLIKKGEELGCPVFQVTNDNGYTPLECCYLYSSSKTMLLLEPHSQLSPICNQVLLEQHSKLEGLSSMSFRRERIEKVALFASALGDVRALEILLKKARDKESLLRHKTKDGWSGVHFAVYNNQLEALKFFPEEFIAEVTDNQGNTPLMLAAARGNLKIIEYLIEKGCDLHRKNNIGENAAFFAAENGQLDTLEFLDKLGADLIAVNDKGENALTLAARNGHLACVSYLLEHGVPIDLKNNQGKTAFQLALEATQLEIAALLVTKSTSIEKDQALFDAVKRGDLEGIQWLVKHGASLSATNESQMTPILLAASLGNIKLIDYFLSIEDHSFAYHKDSEGDNLLFVAIKARQPLLVKHVIDSGYFSVEDRNDKGQTPLLAAAEVNSDALVEFFHQKGSALEDQDNEGNTAYHLLLAKGNFGNAMSYIHAHNPALLLKKNNKEESPLHTVIKHKQTDEIGRVFALVTSDPKAKAELMEARDQHGNTPLLTAVECQHPEAIPILLAAGADVLAKNGKAQSVITIAPLNTLPLETLKLFFDAHQIDYREYYARRRLYFIFGGEKLNESLKFPNADVKFGSGLFDEGVQVLNSYLKTFIHEKHPEYTACFEHLLGVLDKLYFDATVGNILNRLDREGMAFQATGFKGHAVLATLKDLPDGSMKLSLAERGARVGGAPFLNDENKKFAAVRSIIVPKEQRQEVIQLLYQAKNEPQAKGTNILFNQIPEIVGEPYQFSSIYQKKFMDICFYSNPKTGLYEQFIEILGPENGKAFYKEFELYMREQELDRYKEFCRIAHPDESLQENPIIIKAQELVDKRYEVLAPDTQKFHI
ncbi:ankyrin repeat domain-containing protein [Legionella parisiensis]|uniref:Phosphocholine transferase AnkX n=1 Tax=Legionella parisiensis TaxID=45071 RepID=A0A1E5JPA2_9GAMM|nr:ankyrin repeat domain-containing protein [Legionella parisiensis]KTD42011.1 ankyrin repeat-containing protein [Legionella parisiensis]OEH46377.1 Phosphocholine transferase AnkX [Legionella parisiensis]STX75525.1 ankyrin repeat-containing protein [Legionella parisiensis]